MAREREGAKEEGRELMSWNHMTFLEPLTRKKLEHPTITLEQNN